MSFVIAVAPQAAVFAAPAAAAWEIIILAGAGGALMAVGALTAKRRPRGRSWLSPYAGGGR